MNSNIQKLAIWVALIVLAAALFNIFNNPRNATRGTPMSYSEFLNAVQAGNVSTVTIAGNRIHGTLKEGGTAFTTMAGEDGRLVDRLREKDVKFEYKPSEEELPSIMSALISWFPMLLLIGVWVFFMRQMQSGSGRAMGFGKSRAKLLTERHGRVTFEDVAGVDEAKSDLEEIVDFLRDPQKFQRLGGRIPRGALLVGPPGTGKTLLARAIAGEANVPFFTISGSDFVEMFVGVGASRVRDLFEQGKAQAPCIIFIDEIDAVGRHRGAGLGGGHDEREQTLNQLLVEMDGFESNEGVILIAATNRPDVLDPALLRPGRFDRQIVVDAPDLRGREGILKVHVRNKPIAADVDITALARGTPGMAGADLANLVNEGALLAARRNHDKIYRVDLEDAKDRVMLGAERKSLVMKDEERRLTAFHEGGHAVCAIKVKGNDPLHKVTIVPRGRSLGLAFTLPEDDRVSVTREQLEARLVMAFGGRAAEELVFGRDRVTTGAASDIQQATGIARRYVSQWGLSDAIGPVLVGDNEQEVFLGQQLTSRRQVSERTAQQVDDEVSRVIQEAYARAKEVLIANRPLLEAIAAALLERETLTREDFAILIDGGTLPPRESQVNLVSEAIGTPAPAIEPRRSNPPLLGGPEPSPA